MFLKRKKGLDLRFVFGFLENKRIWVLSLVFRVKNLGLIFVFDALVVGGGWGVEIWLSFEFRPI